MKTFPYFVSAVLFITVISCTCNNNAPDLDLATVKAGRPRAMSSLI